MHSGKIISVKIADCFPSDFVKVTAYNTFIMPMRMTVSPTGKKWCFVLLDQDLQNAIFLHAGDMTNLLEKKMSFHNFFRFITFFPHWEMEILFPRVNGLR